MKNSAEGYLVPGRLADVLALIQVLAFHEMTHRTENGLCVSLGAPTSRNTKTWKEIAQEHPEFFRFKEGKEISVSLIARHLSEGEKRQSLPVSHVHELMQLAVKMHDLALKRSEKWDYLVQALIGAGGAVIGALIVVLGSKYLTISKA